MPSDPAFSRAGQQQGGTPQEPPADEPRTETTLTTRIRINIPGSRPIPPVVVRSPMPDGGGDDGEDATAAHDSAAPGPRHRSGSGSSPVIGVMDSANGTAPMPDLPPEWRTGADQGAPAAPAAPAPAAAAEEDAPSTWFAPRRKGSTPPPAATPTPPPAPAPAPAPTPLPYEQPGYEQPAPQGYDQQGYDQAGYPPPVYEPQPDYGRPVYQQQPYGAPAPEADPRQPQAPQPSPAAARPTGGNRPSGMNGGLIVGGPDAATAPSGPNGTGVPNGMNALDTTIPLAVVRDPSQQAPGQQAPSPQAQAAAKAQARDGQAPGAPQPPRAPRPSPRGASAPGAAPLPGSAPRPQGGAPARPRPTPVADGFAGGTGGAGAPPRKESAEAKPAASASAPKRGGAVARGRKLLVTGTSLLVLAAGVAYGAGLALNQADVPKGTTVLGQNIGGDTRDVAVHTLDSTIGVSAAKPLQLVVGGKTVELQTSVAGLSIDTTATVAGVAHHDYNPVSVVKSLFGGEHPVAPTVRIDSAKLRSALQTLASGSAGSAKEGYVGFTSSGGVVTVLPRPGKALDVTTSVRLVEEAYQERAAGLPDHSITLPVTASQPRASAAAVKAAAKGLGAYAVGNKFTVQVQTASLMFGKNAFSEALTLRPDASGKLVPVFDLAKLQAAYGPAFAGVQAGHNGVLGPVTPQDIATALTKLLENPGGPRSITL